jgi:hypothetical protein
MKIHLLTLTAALLAVACNTTSQPNLDGGAPEAGFVEAGAARVNPGLFLRRNRHPSPHFALAGAGDKRTPAEIAAAACQTPTGWACPALARPRILAASQTTTPPSWTVPKWYVDPANLTGCASNGNSCTSATCGSSGTGPCLNASEIVGHRWGTNEPILAQSTTIFLLSGQTNDQEYDVFKPIMVSPYGSAAGSVFGIVGTPSVVAGTPTTLGTVTPKCRTTGSGACSGAPASGQPLSANMGSVTNLAVGEVVVDTMRASSWALIENISGNTVTFTQPLQALTIANSTLYPQPSENDTWATGDSITVEAVPEMNLKLLQPRGGDSDSTYATGLTWVQNIRVPDVSGTTASTFAPQSGDETIVFVGCDFDPFLATGPGPEVYQSTYLIGSGSNGVTLNYGTVLGGYVHTYGLALTGQGDVDLDSILRAGLAVSSSPNYVGYAYVSHQAVLDVFVYEAGTLLLDDGLNGTEGATLYGTGNLAVRAQGAFLQSSGGTWATRVYLSGQWSIGNVQSTVATMYDAGAWTDGITITAANLDAHSGSLQDPRTGAKYANVE